LSLKYSNPDIQEIILKQSTRITKTANDFYSKQKQTKKFPKLKKKRNSLPTNPLRRKISVKKKFRLKSQNKNRSYSKYRPKK